MCLWMPVACVWVRACAYIYPNHDDRLSSIDHIYESWAELHITVDKYGVSRYGGDSNCHLPKISLLHTGCGKTRQAGVRGGDSCLWTEFARWLYPCTRGFSTANADIQVET